MLELKLALDLLLKAGMADEPWDHARQVAMITAIISRAFDDEGMRCTLVGGSAIEVHAPGIFKSGDIDLVIEQISGPFGRDRLDHVFARTWVREGGSALVARRSFVEVPGATLEDPAEVVRIGSLTLRVIAKEALLADRVVGFKYWRQTSYGQQAVDMIVAFGDDLRMEILRRNLDRERAMDAFEALRALAMSDDRVDEPTLQEMLERLTGR